MTRVGKYAHPHRLAATPSALDLVQLGDARRKTGDLKQAEQAYRQATHLDPGCGHAWRELGCLMLDCRRFSEAIVCFHRVSGQDLLPDWDDSAQHAAELLATLVAADPGWERG